MTETSWSVQTQWLGLGCFLSLSLSPPSFPAPTSPSHLSFNNSLHFFPWVADLCRAFPCSNLRVTNIYRLIDHSFSKSCKISLSFSAKILEMSLTVSDLSGLGQQMDQPLATVDRVNETLRLARFWSLHTPTSENLPSPYRGNTGTKPWGEVALLFSEDGKMDPVW